MTGLASARSRAAKQATGPPSRGTPPPPSRRSDIHQVGLAELDQLASLWSTIGRQALGESDFATIAARMRDDPALRFRTSAEIVAVARTPSTGPRPSATPTSSTTTFPAAVIEEVNPIDADNTAMAYYRPPAVDGGPGAHCLLTTDPGERYRYEYEALAFHESVPGHHLQLATAQTLDIPRYRRHLDAELCAFNEGWGLYAERLADEIGLYSTRSPGSAGVLRRPGPCRLVVDTGLHQLGWSVSRRSTSCTTTPRPPAATRPTNRPLHRLAWAGARLRTGKREIVRLRARPSAPSARVRAARVPHAVLRNGAIPLTLLDDEIERWTATEART